MWYAWLAAGLRLNLSDKILPNNKGSFVESSQRGCLDPREAMNLTPVTKQDDPQQLRFSKGSEMHS